MGKRNCQSRGKGKEEEHGTALAVQWLRPCTSSAGGMGLTPGRRRSCMPRDGPKK